jgi:hypothetical protein
MSTSTIPNVEEITTWFTQSHVTITFETASGGHYTLVVRPKIAVLIKDNAGQAWRGQTIKIHQDHIHHDAVSIELWTPQGMLRRTTPVVSFYVATN